MLEIYKLFPDIDRIATNTVMRDARISANIDSARDTLRSLAATRDDLESKIQKARSLRWNGASIPEYIDEPIDGSFDAPMMLGRVNIVAADGSQIFPDRHGVALYYLINIGSIIFRHGITRTPEGQTQTYIGADDEELYDGDGVVTNSKISAQRDLRELEKLKELCEAESKEDKTVALLDNGLLPVFLDRSQDENLWKTFIKKSLELLQSIQNLASASVAGVVNEPRATHVVSLLHLSTFTNLNLITQDSLPVFRSTFQHITDAALFKDLLRAGQRSAIFITDSSLNREEYKGEQQIHFFYLNVSDNEKYKVILRVEIPRWVAVDKEKRDLVHAAIYSQCKVMNNAPYPYILTCAHEQAVVTSQDRQLFEREISVALIRSGRTPKLSEKQQGKNMLRRR